MSERRDPNTTAAFHITDVSNLPAILTQGGLLADNRMAQLTHTNIGYDHIKQRRLTEIRVDCCADRPFVGEFVPFYYCPRSVMLYVINGGRTGRPPGCQKTVVHLVCSVGELARLGADWAISDGNAGAYHALFAGDLAKLDELDWAAIRAGSWKGLTHQKQAEFLVKGFVPWSAVKAVGCYDQTVASTVLSMLSAAKSQHVPKVEVRREWYY